jgi:excisionase family DNA binding protein
MEEATLIQELKSLAFVLKQALAENNTAKDEALLEAEKYKRMYEELKLSLNDKMITGADAARALGVTGGQITKMRHNGKLKAVVIGKTWRYRESDINKLKTKYHV